MCAAVATLRLALCAALTLRASTHCQSHENLPDNETRCAPPIMGVNQYNYTTNYYYSRTVYDTNNLKNNVSVPFGTTVDVWCTRGLSSLATVRRVTMTRDGQILPTKKQIDTIVWSTGKQDALQSEYEYVCTDVETNCKRSVITLVTPGTEVISANIQVSNDNGHINYIVQYGESMTVMCFGPDAARLVMSLRGETLLTERESDTAIKRFEREPLGLQTSDFVCTDVFTTYNRSVTVRVVPTVYFQSQNETVTLNMYFNEQEDVFVYHFDYVDTIEVYCSGPRAVQLIEKGRDEDTFVPTENCNSSTVKLMKKLKLGQSHIHCSGCEVADYVNRVRVIVTPRIEVKSPNVLHVGNRVGVAQYAIKYGPNLEIICSSTDSAQLRISYKYLEDCAVQIVNETAIKCIITELKRDDVMFIKCYRVNDSFGDEPAWARVGVLPSDVKDFRCVSHRAQYLNCSWTAPKYTINFTLSYLENRILTIMCAKRSSRGPRASTFCTWDYSYDSKQIEAEVLTLILKTCNSFGCSDQNFHIDHASIVKHAPPRGLKVLNTTARAAVLEWSVEHLLVAGEYTELEYKVQYWYSGIETRDVNSTLATCDIFYCKIQLILPCPGQFYRVLIYHKLKTAVGEEFWSDPSFVSFHTSVVENDTMDDPTCSWKPRKTPEVMKYIVQEHKQNVHLDMQPLKEKVRSLKAKLAAIRTYLEQGKGAHYKDPVV